MSIACDFCGKPAEKHDDPIFVAAPSGLVHICEECVQVAADVIAARKKENEK